jgi:HAD superfamily phosphoserine phosphatase-like hydrolase
MSIVVFDFDRTLTRDDTIRGFYRSISPSWPDWQRRVAPVRAAWTLGRLRLLPERAIKRIGFARFLSGRAQTDLELLGARYVRTLELHEAVVERLDRHVRDGSRVFVLSASWEVYVRAFRPEITTVATPIEYVGGIARKMGRHCAGEAKAEALRSRFGIHRVDEAYSDSFSDLPLLRMAERPFFVERDGTIRELSFSSLRR